MTLQQFIFFSTEGFKSFIPLIDRESGNLSNGWDNYLSPGYLVLMSEYLIFCRPTFLLRWIEK